MLWTLSIGLEALDKHMARIAVGDDQAQEVIPEVVQDAGPGTNPFFSYQYLDGDKKEFMTAEDLKAGFRKSYLRSKEVERDKAKWGSERTEIQSRLDGLQREREHERNIAAQYLEWDRRLQSDPNVYAQVKSIIDGGNMNNNGRVAQANGNEAQLLEKIEALERRLDDSDGQSTVEEAWENVSAKYPDMDRGAVQELLARVQDGQEGDFLDVLYHASRGYSLNGTQGDVVEENADRERESASLTPPGTAISSAGQATYDSPQDAADQAYKDLVKPG
jgi:hypothetical protein